MVEGVHFLLYARDPQRARDFLRDALRLPAVEAGEGWLIFALPPSELGVHPVESGAPPASGQPRCEVFLMCRDLAATIAEWHGRGVEFTSPVSEQPWGRLTTLRVPGAGEIGLYEPKHPTAVRLGD